MRLSFICSPVEERLEPSRVKTELNKAGYGPVNEPVFLPNQYFLIFTSTNQRSEIAFSV
jgi:hypothetical protein